MDASDQLTEDDLLRLRAATGAYFAAAGHLAQAALTLRLAAMSIEDERGFLLDRLGAIRPAGETEEVVETESDREFLTDRAETYEAKVRQLTEWGRAILADLARWHESIADDRSDAPVTAQSFGDTLADYRRDIDRAAREMETIAANLHGSAYTASETWQESLAHVGIAIRFLESEAALFDALIEDE